MKTPTSKFEKFITGLVILRDHQASAHMVSQPGRFLVGNASDPYLSKGLFDYLDGLGFAVDEKSQQFVFTLKEE